MYYEKNISDELDSYYLDLAIAVKKRCSAKVKSDKVNNALLYISNNLSEFNISELILTKNILSISRYIMYTTKKLKTVKLENEKDSEILFHDVVKKYNEEIDKIKRT